jgi:hypothetical protein
LVLICIHLGVQLYDSLKLTLPMQGHWGCARYIYIGSAADGVF